MVFNHSGLLFFFRNLRIGHCVLQAHVLQRNPKHDEDVAADRGGGDITVRVYQVSDPAVAAGSRPVHDDCAVPAVDLFALLRLVGVPQLLQRRVLQPVEPSAVLHGEFEFYHNRIGQQFIPIHSQITELISTSFVLHLASVDNVVTSRKTLAIVGIAILHILASGVDQFISNVFRGEGYPHQVSFEF